MFKELKGIAASDGIAIAKAYLLVEPDLTFEKMEVADTISEINRFHDAVENARAQLANIRTHAAKSLGEDKAQIFDAHLLILNDPELIAPIEETIKSTKVNAETALKEATDTFINLFAAMDNEYMRERAADIKDVRKRVLAHLLKANLPDPSLIDQEVIIIANDLTPSETAQLNRQFVKGFATKIGGRTSHSAIMARSLEIPAVVGTKEITAHVAQDQTVIVDGIKGKIIIDPSQETIEAYKKMQADFASQKAEWEKLKNDKTFSQDGVKVELAANIGTPDDLEGVKSNGGEAVGLYRTEFLYMGRNDFPTEKEQFEAYKKVLEGMEGKSVVVRTLDIGGDKTLPYLKLPEEMNPFLGLRAVRLCFSHQDLFRTQLRALLRASMYGKLKVMFPMIATVSEFLEAKTILLEEKAKLVGAGIAVSDNIELGIMIEIPAAAILADQFAKVVDFFSIGTNDLIQYTMAADRMNEQVSYLYQPYNPSILRLIKNVIDASHKEGKWTGMCGEMAGEELALPLLLGLELDEFSMSASSILKSRALIKQLNHAKMVKLANEALNQSTAEEVVKLVKKYTAK